MAYFSTTGTATDTAALYAALKTFLTTTAGWTLHDDVSATEPYFVAYSPGESGNERIYLRYLDSSTAGRISVSAWQYWNATTHAGVNGAYNTAFPTIVSSDSGSFVYWFFCDLDHVVVVTKISAVYAMQYAGIPDRFWSSSIATASGAISAGSDVVVQVDDASAVTVGKKAVIVDNANIELATVSARDTSSTPNTITFATVAKSYTSGAQIGEDPRPTLVAQNSSLAGYAVNGSNGWTATTGQNIVVDRPAWISYGDPDTRQGLTTLAAFVVYHSAVGNEEIRGTLKKVYATGGGNLSSEDTLTVGSDTYRAFNLATYGWAAIKV